MVEVLFQIFSLLSLVFGIVAGEAITYKIFGVPKPSVIFVDIILFVILISVIFSFVNFTEFNFVYYVVNFLAGFVSIIVIRSMEGVFGMTETTIAQEKLLVNIIRLMARHGFSKEEVEDALKRSGYSPKIVKKYEGMLGENEPHYIPRILKMEGDIENISKKLDKRRAKKKR